MARKKVSPLKDAWSQKNLKREAEENREEIARVKAELEELDRLRSEMDEIERRKRNGEGTSRGSKINSDNLAEVLTRQKEISGSRYFFNMDRLEKKYKKRMLEGALGSRVEVDMDGVLHFPDDVTDAQKRRFLLEEQDLNSQFGMSTFSAAGNTLQSFEGNREAFERSKKADREFKMMMKKRQENLHECEEVDIDEEWEELGNGNFSGEENDTEKDPEDVEKIESEDNEEDDAVEDESEQSSEVDDIVEDEPEQPSEEDEPEQPSEEDEPEQPSEEAEDSENNANVENVSAPEEVQQLEHRKSSRKRKSQDSSSSIDTKSRLPQKMSRKDMELMRASPVLSRAGRVSPMDNYSTDGSFWSTLAKPEDDFSLGQGGKVTDNEKTHLEVWAANASVQQWTGPDPFERDLRRAMKKQFFSS